MTAAGALPRSPRISAPANAALPSASVFASPSTSLLPAISRTSTSPIGCAVSSERAKTCSASRPASVVSPMSDSTTHCVATFHCCVPGTPSAGSAVTT